jgi:hypothetical protein
VTVREVIQPGWVPTVPALGSRQVPANATGTLTFNFGNFYLPAPTDLSATAVAGGVQVTFTDAGTREGPDRRARAAGVGEGPGAAGRRR